MFKYFKTDENGIVVSFHETRVKESDKSWIECPVDDFTLIAGKHWNGSTFEEVPTKEVEVPETTEVTNADLLEVLLAIGEKVGA